MRILNPRGSAIFLALIMMIGALAILMGVLASSTNNVVKHDQYAGREGTYFAAEGVIAQAWGRMYNPIAMRLYTDQGIYNYLAGIDPNSPYRGSFAMQILNGNASDLTTTSDSTMESDWVSLPNLDVPQGNPILAYQNAGFKFGTAYIVDVRARWRRDVNILADRTKKTTWTVTLRATTQNKWNPANPAWYDESDPPAIISQTFQFSQANKSTVLNYVNLARNVSCTLCHTQFQDVINAFNNDAIAKINDPANTNTTTASTAVANKLQQQYGSYPKVKLGTLGNFQVRDLNTVDTNLNGRFYPSDSILDGTLYSRGIIQDNEHNALADVPQAAMMARQFDSVNQDNVYQDKTSGAENTVPMAPAGFGPDGNPIPHQNLYLNYPNSNTVNTISGGTMTQSDGVMPDDFPYPFDPNVPNSLPGYSAQQLADSQSNRLVDGPKVDNWIKQRTDPTATADSSNPNRLGAMKGGYAMVVDNYGNIVSSPTPMPISNYSKLPDVTIGANGKPSDVNVLSSENPSVGGASGIVNGNLVLIGTKDNPVNLSAQVLVKGDVIIKGYYTGVGSMWATGNIYLPSDLRYRDDAVKDSSGNAVLDKNGMPIEDFGNLNSPDKGENLGGMIAGGTIVIGDYLTSSLSAAPTTSSFTDNLPPDTNGQRENSFPLVPTYQKADPNFTYNYRDLNTTNGQYDIKQQQLYAKNFTLSQMELFNRDEWGHTQQFLPNGTNGQFDVANSQYGQFDPVKGTYDQTKPYMPRYYVLNPGDPVGAFVYGSQSKDPTQMQTDAINRVGTEGSYWSTGTATEPPMWKGGEMSKVYNTTTIGGDTAQGAAGSVVNGKETNLIYGQNKNTLVDSTDPNGTQKAAVIAINPQWLGSTSDKSTQTMWSFLLNEEWDRKFNTNTSKAVYGSTTDPSSNSSARDGTPFRLDGLFYTNNAIFGIQRNRSLAPQAAGDYKDVSGPITTGPQAPDPTKPGSWPTPVPDMTYLYDNYEGDVVYDLYEKTMNTDNFTSTPYTDIYTATGKIDNYISTKFKDNYTQPASYDTYSSTSYRDNYSATGNFDTYSSTSYTDNYTQNASYDTYSSTPHTDNYTQTASYDNYSSTPHTDTYSIIYYTDIYKQTALTDNYTYPIRNVTWTLYTGSGYSRQGPFTVTQTSPPGTITQPTTASNGQAVTQATSTETPSTGTATSAVYYNAANPPAVPAGYTKTGTTSGATTTMASAQYTAGHQPAVPANWSIQNTSSTTQTSSSAVYYNSSAAPTVPAGYTKTGTTTSATVTSKSANYTTTAPAVPTNFVKTGTVSTTNTSSSAVYYNNVTAPAVPTGWTKASTTDGATVTSKSSNYTTTPPTVPTNFIKTGTVSTTNTSSSAVYYNSPANAPAVPTGWTKSGTTTGAVITSSSAPYTGTAPTVPANFVKTGTTTTTITSTSAVYYNTATPPAAPAGFSKTTTTNLGTVTSKSANYTGTAPTVPTNFVKTGTQSTTNTSSSAFYYNNPSNAPAVPGGWTVANTTTVSVTTTKSAVYVTTQPSLPTNYILATPATTTTTVTSTSALYYNSTANAPAVPASWTKSSTTTGTVINSQSPPYHAGTTPPAVPTNFVYKDTTSTVTTTRTAGYMNGTSRPPTPTGYSNAPVPTGDFKSTNADNPATKQIQVPYGSTAPAGYPRKLAPSNPSYSYPASVTGTNAKDFKKYAKEMTSSSQGVMVVNGALVAPDLGLLVTGRKSAQNPYTLIMNYDQRVRRLVQFVSNTPDTKWNLIIKGLTRLNVGATNQ